MRSNQLLGALLAAVLLAACQPQAEPPPLPTLAVLDGAAAQPTPTQEDAPSGSESEIAVEPSNTPTPLFTLFPSDTPTLLASATLIPSATFTPLPPTTPPPTATPNLPPTPTLPAVRIATVTPVPGGPVTTRQALADLVITERQFQDEVDRRVPSIDSIQRVRIDFTPGGINAELTALGGVAFVTGNVQLNIQVQGGFAVITIGDITVNAPEPPPTYIEVANREFFSLMIDALDTLLNSRLAGEFNLRELTLTNDTIEVRLLIPAP